MLTLLVPFEMLLPPLPPPVLVIVTAPVAELTLIPVPATIEVTTPVSTDPLPLTKAPCILPVAVKLLPSMLPVAVTNAMLLRPKLLPAILPLILPCSTALAVIPVNADPSPNNLVAMILPPVILPVVEMVFDPKLANNVVTLALA
jgi:hypothetical protein